MTKISKTVAEWQKTINVLTDETVIAKITPLLQDQDDGNSTQVLIELDPTDAAAIDALHPVAKEIIGFGRCPGCGHEFAIEEEGDDDVTCPDCQYEDNFAAFLDEYDAHH